MGSSLSRSPTPERALARLGTVVQQKYRIDRLLGTGGMAAVYRATHRNGHRVAIKFLHRGLEDDAEIYRLFSREAYVANQVGHPGAVPVMDDDVDEDGCPFLIMPLLEGMSLRARWDRAKRRLPLDEVAVFMADALEVLSSAHAKGIIHRDIKPDNLFVTSAGQVRVLDFGIARRLPFGEAALGEGATFTGRMVGTPAFMAPEQASGRREAVGPHSDCWAVGATIFTLLSGELVHPAQNAPAQLAAAATKPARSLGEIMPGLPAPIVELVAKSLAFEPEDRWSSAAEMRAALMVAYERARGESLTAVMPRIREKIVAELAPDSTDAGCVTERPDRLASPPPGPAQPQPMVPAAQGIPAEPVARTLRERELESSNPEPPATPRTDTPRALVARRLRRVRRIMMAGLALPGVVALALVVAVVAGWYQPSASHLVARVPLERADGKTAAHDADAAMVQLNAGLQDWRDAMEPSAKKSFARAIELDPGAAAAHLYLSMIPSWTDDEARAHHHAASSLRTHLQARDLALLDAYAPAMALPPDLDGSLQRLLEARTAFPSDWLVLMSLGELQIRKGQLRAAVDTLEELLRTQPTLAAAWSDLAYAYALLDDTDQTRRALQQCLVVSSYAARCLTTLAKLESHDGQCVEAERHARSLMALPSPNESSATRLAGAIQGRNGSMESVHATLERAWPLAQEAQREASRHQNEALFQILNGRFDLAAGALGEWGSAIHDEMSESPHLKFATVQFQMAMELGDNPRAVQLASEYLSQREAWLPSAYWDWEILPLGTQYIAGGLSREAFELRREAWLTRQSGRAPLVGASNAQWILAYASAVATPEDAKEALRVLPHYLPMSAALTRDVVEDDEIGYVYLLAGDLERARSYLQRGARSCDAVESPFAHTWANLHLGMALQQSGDVAGACAAYDVVLSRWGNEPRSVSARIARTRRAQMKCAAR